MRLFASKTRKVRAATARGTERAEFCFVFYVHIIIIITTVCYPTAESNQPPVMRGRPPRISNAHKSCIRFGSYYFALMDLMYTATEDRSVAVCTDRRRQIAGPPVSINNFADNLGRLENVEKENTGVIRKTYRRSDCRYRSDYNRFFRNDSTLAHDRGPS